MNYKYILSIEGKILMILSGFMLTIFPWIFHFGEMELLVPIVVSFLITFCTGFLLDYRTKNILRNLHLKDAYFLVSISWVVMGLFGSLPFFVSGTIPSFTDAFFESVSGFTTTGSSILTDIESLPKSVLFWRSFTHWIGGMGIIVLVVAVLPHLNIAGYQLLTAEMSGCITSEKIKPRVKEVAIRLWYIYLLLTSLVTFMLVAGGLNFYEGICHAFGTVATGGFSTKNASIGHYSPYVQYVVMVFMLLSGINFTLHFFILTGRFQRILNDSELKAYAGIILFFTIVISLILYFSQEGTLEEAFRHSIFQVVSIITATGYATTDYLQWVPQAWFLIFMLMFVGACVGSTGGGIKVVRHVVAFKLISKNFMSLIHPQMVRSIIINDNPVTNEKAIAVTSFIFLYLTVVLGGAVFLTILGVDLETSVGAVLATLGGIGPGIGEVGPAGNFSLIPDTGKILLSFIMILGRLELITLLVLLTPGFWKK
jgi:trk system potassium uptake protein